MARARVPEAALIVRVRLPRALDAVRRGAVPDADHGLPAHVTLLYPFVPPEALDHRLRTAIAEVVAAHTQFSFRLTSPARWPETLYASVEPEVPFRSLHADLTAALPQHPLHSDAFDFVPHVTIARGAPAGLPEVAGGPAWATLPLTLTARSVELIVRDAGIWRTKWRFVLRPVAEIETESTLREAPSRRGDGGRRLAS